MNIVAANDDASGGNLGVYRVDRRVGEVHAEAYPPDVNADPASPSSQA